MSILSPTRHRAVPAHPGRWCVAALLLSAACGLGQEIADPPLWQFEKFDRVELANGQTHDIDPVRIPAGTRFSVDVQDDPYVGRPGLPPIRDLRRNHVYEIVRQNDGRRYRVTGADIQGVAYYEDLLIEQTGLLIEEGDFQGAFLYLRKLLADYPYWPGVDATLVRFHRQEGIRRAAPGTFHQAFESLAEAKRVWDRMDPDSRPTNLRPPAPDLDQASRRWFDDVTRDERYREGRRIVVRLERVYPESRAAANARRRYRRLSDEAVARATEFRSRGEPVDALDSYRRAIEIDPTSPGARNGYLEQFERLPHLRVAVEGIASFINGPGRWTRADERAGTILHLPVMFRDPEAPEDRIRFESEIVRGVEREDINRRAIFTTRPGLRWPGDGKPVTSTDLTRLIAACCREGSPVYHPAFARLVLGLRQEEDRVVVEFDRPQYRPEAWLQLPMFRPGEEAASGGLRVTRASGLGPFELVEARPERARFLANERYLRAPRPGIRLLSEYRIDSLVERLRAMRDGDVDLVASLPPWQIDNVGKLEGVRIVGSREPRVHLIQFNLAKRALRDRGLRRAMVYAIDRASILERLGLPVGGNNQVLSGLLPIGSFGTDPEVRPRPYDPLLARLYADAVRRKNNSIPAMRMLHIGDEVSRRAAEEVVGYWQRAGVDVRVIDFDPERPVDAVTIDLLYITYRVGDPLYESVTLLTRDNPSLVRFGSPWLRQRLVELVEVPNEAAARLLLPKLHRKLQDDAAIIPLFQCDEFAAFADRVSGVPERVDHPYAGVERWAIEPSLPPAIWADAESGLARGGDR